MVKYTHIYKGSHTVREYTESWAHESIGIRVSVGFSVVTRPLEGLVYFVNPEGHVWAIYEFKAV